MFLLTSLDPIFCCNIIAINKFSRNLILRFWRKVRNPRKELSLCGFSRISLFVFVLKMLCFVWLILVTNLKKKMNTIAFFFYMAPPYESRFKILKL